MRDQASEARPGWAWSVRPAARWVQILGGNCWVGQVIQAIILDICLAAFGVASLSQLILVDTFVDLFADMIPVLYI